MVTIEIDEERESRRINGAERAARIGVQCRFISAVRPSGSPDTNSQRAAAPVPTLINENGSCWQGLNQQGTNYVLLGATAAW